MRVMWGSGFDKSACDAANEIHFYHVCTKGLESKLLFYDDNDYQKAVNVLAIVSWVTNVNIFAYCFMTNHLHILIGAKDRDAAECFMIMFKKDYSQYYARRYRADRIMKRVVVTVKEMCDIPYVRNCVAYVLRNPVDGGLVKAAEKYEWSSIGCYFSGEPCRSQQLSCMSIRQIKSIIGTHRDIRDSKMRVDDKGIVPKSFVDYRLVENLFQNSSAYFWSQILKVDSAQMEYDLAVGADMRYNDYEMIARISDIAGKWFGKPTVSELSIRDRCKIAGYMYRRLNSGIPQISRLLGIERRLVKELLGKTPVADE